MSPNPRRPHEDPRGPVRTPGDSPLPRFPKRSRPLTEKDPRSRLVRTVFGCEFESRRLHLLLGRYFLRQRTADGERAGVLQADALRRAERSSVGEKRSAHSCASCDSAPEWSAGAPQFQVLAGMEIVQVSELSSMYSMSNDAMSHVPRSSSMKIVVELVAR
jgi:hypothetical protein